MRFSNGDTYLGTWVLGRREGSGQYIWAHDRFYRRYDGDFSVNLRHGRGVMRYTNGNVYDGEWENGCRSGLGKLVAPDNGEGYEGQWKNGVRHGQGLRTYSNGDRYEGFFKEDHKEGPGVYKTAGGQTYKVEWKDGKCTGRMRMIYPDGGVYEGELVSGVKEGFGTYTKDENTYSGLWVGDHMEGFGHIKYKEGDEYYGQFVNNEKSGDGIYVWKNGYVYKGPMREDKSHGIGRLYRLEHEGNWREGAFTGSDPSLLLPREERKDSEASNVDSLIYGSVSSKGMLPVDAGLTFADRPQPTMPVVATTPMGNGTKK